MIVKLFVNLNNYFNSKHQDLNPRTHWPIQFIGKLKLKYYEVNEEDVFKYKSFKNQVLKTMEAQQQYGQVQEEEEEKNFIQVS